MSARDAARYEAAQSRAARQGWVLAWVGGEFELTGNGSIAAFGRLDSFLEWISHVERLKR